MLTKMAAKIPNFPRLRFFPTLRPCVLREFAKCLHHIWQTQLQIVYHSPVVYLSSKWVKMVLKIDTRTNFGGQFWSKRNSKKLKMSVFLFTSGHSADFQYFLHTHTHTHTHTCAFKWCKARHNAFKDRNQWEFSAQDQITNVWNM